MVQELLHFFRNFLFMFIYCDKARIGVYSSQSVLSYTLALLGMVCFKILYS